MKNYIYKILAGYRRTFNDLFYPSKTVELEAIYFNVLNINNRIYLREEVEPHLTTLSNKIVSYGALYGELGHPEGMEMNLGMISHQILSFRIDDRCLYITIRTLQTTSGKTLRDNLKDYVFRSRSAGVIDSDNIVRLKEIFTFDAILKDLDSFPSKENIQNKISELDNNISELLKIRMINHD